VGIKTWKRKVQCSAALWSLWKGYRV
jgi:hypothetical protein